MNSSSSQKTYMRMQNTVLNNPDATCMLVEVIAKNSQNIVWRNSLDGIAIHNDKIRKVSVDKFYEIVKKIIVINQKYISVVVHLYPTSKSP